MEPRHFPSFCCPGASLALVEVAMTGVRIQFEILAGTHARMRSIRGKISAARFRKRQHPRR
jgi:hypothetical protein